MDIIGERKIWTYGGVESEAIPRKNPEVRNSRGHKVANYMDLATKVAELQFKNRDFILLFRGQNRDYKDGQNVTTLKPSIMRGQTPADVPDMDTLSVRFERLQQAEEILAREYGAQALPAPERLRRQRILRWSILQHYEVCETPLLDVTHSLRIAASFASSGADDEAFVFVLGVPHLGGAVTASAEAGLQIVRLASVCPPAAVRPHIQEGYLLGEYPDISGTTQKELYPHEETDFGRRLLAKFRFDPARFWYKSESFPRVPRDALYPPQDHDPLCQLASTVQWEIAG